MLFLHGLPFLYIHAFRWHNPERMRLYVVGGGGCMIRNLGADKSRITIVRDVCGMVKRYEAMSERKIQRNGGVLV